MTTFQDSVVAFMNHMNGSQDGSVIFCSLTELFTTNKHATYCTNIFYPVATCDETILFDTVKGNCTQKLHICLCFVFKKLFMKSDLAPN